MQNQQFLRSRITAFGIAEDRFKHTFAPHGRIKRKFLEVLFCATGSKHEYFRRRQRNVEDLDFIIKSVSDLRLETVGALISEKEIQRTRRFHFFKRIRDRPFRDLFSVDEKADFPVRLIPGKRNMMPLALFKQFLPDDLNLFRSTDAEFRGAILEVDHVKPELPLGIASADDEILLRIIFLPMRLEPESNRSAGQILRRQILGRHHGNLIVGMTPHIQRLSDHSGEISGAAFHDCGSIFLSVRPDHIA